MLYKYCVRVWLFLVVISVSNTAFATGYFGVGFGKAQFDIKPLFGTNEVDDGTPFRLFGGVRGGNLGWETEISFADYDWSNKGGSATHHAGNVVISGLGYLPLSKSFDLYGKIGINFWNTTVDYAGATYEGESGADIAYGAGVNISATEAFSIRLEYQALPGLSDGVDDGDISQYTLNALFNF